MLALTLAALAAPCDLPVLKPALTRAEDAYLKGDAAALKREAREARGEARCDDLTPELAARVHRVAALEHALANDWDAVVVDLRASQAAHPLLPLDPALAADTRLALAWQRAQEQAIAWTLSRPALVNGMNSALRPDAPVLARGGRGNGLRWAALGAGAVAGGLYAGAWVAHGRYDAVAGKGDRAPVVRAHTTTNALSVGSLGAAVLGAGLLGASFAF